MGIGQVAEHRTRCYSGTGEGKKSIVGGRKVVVVRVGSSTPKKRGELVSNKGS